MNRTNYLDIELFLERVRDLRKYELESVFAQDEEFGLSEILKNRVVLLKAEFERKFKKGPESTYLKALLRHYGPVEKPVLDVPIEMLDISVRLYNVLKTNKIHYLGEIVENNKLDLRKKRDFREKSIKELEGMLESIGLKLGMVVDYNPPSEKEDSAR